MSGNYEHEQAQLLNAAAQAVQTAVAVGVQLSSGSKPPLKVQIRTAEQDVQDARKAIQQGTPKEIILKSIHEGEAARRVADRGGDSHKYEQLILQRAEIEHALEMMPSSQAPSQAKTPKKSL